MANDSVTTTFVSAELPASHGGKTTRRIARFRKPRVAGYLFVLPYLVLLIVFGVNPTIFAFFISFFKGGLDNLQFAGLENFQAIVGDIRVPTSFGNVLSYIIRWIPLMVVFVPLLAFLLDMRTGLVGSTLAKSVRFIYYLPSAITGAASVLIWLFMFDPSLSPFAFFFRIFGFDTIDKVLAPQNLPLAYAVMAFTTGAGVWVVTFFGALKNIPIEIREAALIDGCGEWQMARYIKLPLISKYIIYMIVLVFSAGFQLTGEPAIINAATQGRLGGYSWTPNVIAFEYASKGIFGVAGAISLLLFIVTISIALFLIFRTDFYRVD